MKTTPWFDGEIKPVRVGVYQRKWDDGSIGYAKWHGEHWGPSYDVTNPLAVQQADRSGFGFQTLMPWRGLAEEPK
jgi:hypothetical protein